jgi:hypothetical protein
LARKSLLPSPLSQEDKHEEKKYDEPKKYDDKVRKRNRLVQN